MPKAKTPRPTTTSNKPIITMPEPGTQVMTRKNPSPGVPTPIDVESLIRQRAYELYVERGGTPGLANEDWIQAEREVRARQDHKQSA